jgi:hypothetical protein
MNTNNKLLTPPPTEKIYTQLPILEKLLAAYKIWQKFLPNIPRLSRYTLAKRIDNLFLELLESILILGYSGKLIKNKIIHSASRKLDLLKFLFRVGWEIKAIDNKKYINISKSLTEIGKMLGGWQKQIKNTPPEKEE